MATPVYPFVAIDVQRNELARRLFSVNEIPATPNYPKEAQGGRKAAKANDQHAGKGPVVR